MKLSRDQIAKCEALAKPARVATAERVAVSLTIPVKVVSEANTRCHWATRYRRVKAQKQAVLLALATVSATDRNALRTAPRVRVKLARIGGRKLDRDNLFGAFKAVLDAVCGWLQIDDGSDRIDLAWPVQEVGKGYAIRIELEAGQ